MSDPFLGEIRMVGFNYAPYGWALCQGQTMSISQNNALFALLGTSFGGNGQSTFQLPDLQSRTPVGMGQGLGLSAVEIGEKAGTENATLTVSNMPQHTHTASVSGGGAVTGSISIPATTTTGSEGASPSNTSVLGPIGVSGHPGSLYSTATPNTTLAPFNVSLQGAAPAVQNSIAGSGLPFSLRNPYLGINFIIALQGVYPSRG
ncbi:phage tail protein [Trinickia dabaoshanensis]|uniref:Phage tail protein n=1 Tax=Trinickia dabaoshanensis TaxID=564714 RepID=A0A2N7W150_9BURK|nr:tail fiber protein [Trinickia dabaoshanensis]PMS23095.1 phage tail protein [Trinickia dabaoshanensis]